MPSRIASRSNGYSFSVSFRSAGETVYSCVTSWGLLVATRVSTRALPLAPGQSWRQVASLKSIIATDARRLARGRLQVDHAPAGIQEVYEATHGRSEEHTSELQS